MLIDSILKKDNDIFLQNSKKEEIKLDFEEIKTLSKKDFFSILLYKDILSEEKNFKNSIILPSFQTWIDFKLLNKKKISMEKFLLKNSNSFAFLFSYFKYDYSIYQNLKYKFFFKYLPKTFNKTQIDNLFKIFPEIDKNIVVKILKKMDYDYDYKNKNYISNIDKIKNNYIELTKNSYKIEEVLSNKNLILLTLSDFEDENFLKVNSLEEFNKHKNNNNIYINILKTNYNFLIELCSLLNLKENLQEFQEKQYFFDIQKNNVNYLTLKNAIIYLKDETFPFCFSNEFKLIFKIFSFEFFELPNKNFLSLNYIKEILEDFELIEDLDCYLNTLEENEDKEEENIKKTLYINDYYDLKKICKKVRNVQNPK